MRNLYTVLGTSRDADHSQLKLAYRNLAKTSHPDLNAGDKRAEERFKELNQAYEVLRDPGARAAYDAFLADKQTVARHRFRNAALTTVAAFVLCTAVCFPLMVWLRGERPHLGATGGQSGHVAVAAKHPLSGADGPSPQKTGEEEAMLSASLQTERRGRVQMRGEETPQGGIVKPGAEDATRDQRPSEWNGDVIANTVLLVEPRPRRRDGTMHAAILDGAKQSSVRARRNGTTKVSGAEGVEKRAADRIAPVSALAPAAVGSDKLRGWLTADEPFVGPGGIGR
jgi:curved DNA-binding protein CbpA